MDRISAFLEYGAYHRSSIVVFATVLLVCGLAAVFTAINLFAISAGAWWTPVVSFVVVPFIIILRAYLIDRKQEDLDQ